ncbi:hypothetical protein Tco_1553753 [Tanacetum coccineum]
MPDTKCQRHGPDPTYRHDWIATWHSQKATQEGTLPNRPHSSAVRPVLGQWPTMSSSGTLLGIPDYKTKGIAHKPGMGQSGTLAKQGSAYNRDLRTWAFLADFRCLAEVSSGSLSSVLLPSDFYRSYKVGKVRSKCENKGIVPTEMELELEQTQQGSSHEVSVSTEGVEE